MPKAKANITVIDSGGAKYSYVVAGARLQCTYGSKTSKLKMPLSHGVYIKNKAQMNIMDFISIKNISSFGTCASIQNPACGGMNSCVPVVTMPWMNGKDDVLIENFPALLSISTNMCIYAGQITITEDGQ